MVKIESRYAREMVTEIGRNLFAPKRSPNRRAFLLCERNMKRDWKVVRKILEHVESDDLREYLSRDGFAELHITEEEFLGHIEILADAGIIKNATVRRSAEGAFCVCGLNGVFITMAGHDLLDALRDATVWSRVLDKASRAGVRVSWEFIKAAIPVIMREIVS